MYLVAVFLSWDRDEIHDYYQRYRTYYYVVKMWKYLWGKVYIYEYLCIDRTYDLPRLVNWLYRRATQRQSVRDHSWCLAPPHGMHCHLNCGNGTWVWKFSVKNWKLCCSNQCEIDSGINLSKFFFIFYCFNLDYLLYFFPICNFVLFVPTAVLWDY